MNRRSILGLSAVAALGLAVLPGSAISQQKTLKEQLVGTWTLVSTDNTGAFGANPKGMLVFDGNGRYSLVFMRSDLPKFAAKTSNQGTAEENKSVMQGMVAHFGTYSVNETDKTLMSRIEGATFPNSEGEEQKRIITRLTSDELRYANPETTLGASVEAVWRRIR